MQRFRHRAIDPIPLAMSLDEYALAGVDKLGFRRHFFNWYDRFLVHPTLFIRYETLWDNLDSLMAFFGLPESAAQRFPVKKDRMSAIDSVSEQTLRGLRKLYGPFAEELARLGDVEVRCRPAGQRARLLRYGRLYAPILADAFVRDRSGAIKNRLLGKFRRIRRAIAS